MKVRLHGVLGNAEQRGDLGDAGPEPIVEPQRRLVHVRQLLNAFRQCPLALPRNQLVHRARDRRRCFEEPLVTDMRRSIADARFQVQRLIECDAIDPRSELRVTTERGERVVHAQKHLLGNFLSLSGEALAKDGDGQAEHRLSNSTSPRPIKTSGSGMSQTSFVLSVQPSAIMDPMPKVVTMIPINRGMPSSTALARGTGGGSIGSSGRGMPLSIAARRSA